MFYEPLKRDHGLPHDPFKALIAPRPIGWIGSYGEDGIANLAPYSFFNAFSSYPPIVGFGSDGLKDSAKNIEKSGAFSCNLVAWDLKNQMNSSSAGVPSDVNEFELSGLTKKQCKLVNAPYVGETPAVFECVHLETKRLVDRHGKALDNYLVLGEVVGIFIDESVIKDGLVDPGLLRPVARMGYMDYTVADKPFSLKRP